MEVEFQGRRIQWDDEKNEINRKKHGFTLEHARFVFADPNRIELMMIYTAMKKTAIRSSDAWMRFCSLFIRNVGMLRG